MKKHFSAALKLTFITAAVFGFAYPLLITGIANLIGPNQGKGEFIMLNGKVVGFELIGQNFAAAKYFHGRPSAVDYNAAATGGSNKGPTNPEYLALVQARIDTLLMLNPNLHKEQIPVDLITASGSGLDPHISTEAARIQIPRISKVRGISIEKVTRLVNNFSEAGTLGMGPSRVHLLRLNIALDELK
jgi:potassium-transporting ATPase KdpC subunit